jgi:hypothetical protein
MTESPIRKSSPWVRIVPLLILAAALVVVGYLKRDVLFPGLEPEPVPEFPAAGKPAEPETPPPAAADQTVEERRWLEATGLPPVWPEDFDTPGDCATAVDTLKALCGRLDSRPYVQAWGLEGGSFGLLLDVSSDLERRTPVIEGELRRHGSVLHNVSHLFRVLGERRIRRLLEMTILEPEMREPMALALYRWGRVRQRCEGDEPRAMNLNAQYDYAAWLISTIGGQAYLRRRAPGLEALASFYALVILDRAEQKGHNPYGIDLRPEIARCSELIRSQNLVFRDRYMEILDRMDRRWKSR